MSRARLLLATLVVAVATTVAPVGPPPAHAAPVVPAAPAWSEGACAPTDNVGVTVVVDFQELGGGVNVRCTDGSVADGADALDHAGINWQGVVRWGRGFVCKIAGKPSNDPCIDTPPASAYWSYWIAARGGSWCYANFGVLNRTPPPGSVEGWSFSLNKQDGSSPPPRYAPPGLAPGLTPNPLAANDCDPGGSTVDTAPPAPATTRPPAGTPGGGTTGTGPGGLEGRPGGPSGDAGSTSEPTAGDGTTTSAGSSTTTTGPGITTTTTATSTTGDAGPSPGRGGGDGGPDDAEQAGPINQTDLSTDGHEQVGFPLSTVLGLVLITALGIGAALARRRRHLAAGAGAGTDDLRRSDT